jgi:hypothetical protein
MRKKISFTLIFVGLFILLIACSPTKYYNDDPFYAYSGEWDSIRFPLIKPYEVGNLGMGDGWGMNLSPSLSVTGIQGYIGIEDVQKISVENGVILVYTQHKPYIDKEAGEKVLYWFVIIPAKKIETGFDNEDDFLKNIQEYDISKPTWEDPDTIYKKFEETGCLEWIPGCQ